VFCIDFLHQSQWLHSLMYGSVATGLLGLWVRILPGGMDVLSLVSVVYCQVDSPVASPEELY
jgi:hypothetical protein